MGCLMAHSTRLCYFCAQILGDEGIVEHVQQIHQMSLQAPDL
jgi:hypothetical protein